ncbi:MAG: M14 family metallopeptidase [Ignavibacteria bacterium]|nr:M14 family metallopeptidase [Ignavibacteria bacterium]
MRSISRIFLLIIIGYISLQAEVPGKAQWATVFEKSGFLRTARYEETMAYFRKLEKASPYVTMRSFGKSPQGRDLYYLVISKEKTFTSAAARKTGKPILCINNGIHSGEIEGKDACMILLREMLVTKEKAALLDKITLLVIPIFSVDGHERFSAGNRINQNGPEEMGWRTTAQNLNLNRDWIKADAPEMQAMLRLMSEWLPDYFIDTHTTDGADFQYTANYGLEKFQNMYAPTANLIRTELIPHLVQSMAKDGYLIAPYAWFREEDYKKGISDFPGTPRFSTGYFAAQNRIALLVETHMLKPYKDRVFATKSMIEGSIQFIANNAKRILALNVEADRNEVQLLQAHKEYLPLQYKITDQGRDFTFHAIGYEKVMSDISGTIKTVYTGRKADDTITYYDKARVTDSVSAPYGYIIPAEWSILADRLKLHGVKVQQVRKTVVAEVTRYKFSDVKFNERPYEGRHMVNFQTESYQEKVVIPAGSFFIPTGQRTIKVILHALEPRSPDSFIRWGFMNAIFEQKEYFENYVMERVAAEMLAKDSQLQEEFRKKLETDSVFKASPEQRLQFFYRKSVYWDKQLNVYPVLRLEIENKLL